MQSIRTRYFGHGNVLGSRVSASCQARTIYLDWDDRLSAEENHERAAIALCEKLNWPTAIIGGVFQHDHYWVFIPPL